ncbi:YbaB/EbfC family nucleoid-associated protein [Nocardia sp. NPDC050712]|uniref:YbaB/EbfC family nucleoid-associated protein n=1 Tax=Nocardia sp. NPDC050712 TaxID=3155518 RepID=UPI0033D6031D
MYETMDELEASVQRKLYRIRDLVDDMGAVKVRETSPDGSITAEVDGNGALLNLEFSQEISRLSPEDFEATLTATARAAAAAAFARRADIVTAFNEEVAE